MMHINTLISDLKKQLPLKPLTKASDFLSALALDDQCALISAMYIGRDHIHDTTIRPDYIPAGINFDRYFITGNQGHYQINPADFARILFEKEHCLDKYLTAFTTCCIGSSIDLSLF